MRVINLFAGPGSGKSTTAAGLFHFMKLKDYKVELVTEYAKELTYDKRHDILADQLYVLAKQNRRLERLKGQVDFAITDSPLLLGLIYTRDDYLEETFNSLVIDLFNTYDNINFYINRVKKYKTYGRNQTELEAIKKDHEIFEMLRKENITHRIVAGDAEAPHNILKVLESNLV